jgi:2-desacetyl-2-hydroxyethyl bacteriochlorophyllide A dehydrogenase
VTKIKENEVLVRTKKSLISIGTELTILSGQFPQKSYWSSYGKYPFVPGYSNIGEIIEVGSNVDKNLIGKVVASYSPHALYNSVARDSLRFVPTGISGEDASFFTIAEIVMNGVRRSQLVFGESVVIYGAGLLGQITTRICEIAGARPIIVVDVSEYRLSFLPNNVAKVNPLSQDPALEVKKLTKERLADVVFEVTGNPDIVTEELRCLRKLGRFVILSSPRGPSTIDLHDFCNAPSFTFVGAHNSSHPPVETLNNPWTYKRHAELFFDLVLSKELEVSKLVTHRVPYEGAPKVYEQLLEDRTKAIGVIIDWE